MSVEEQMRWYMLGWRDGVSLESKGASGPSNSGTLDPYSQGYQAGRAAYLAAEQAERERLEECPCGQLVEVASVQYVMHSPVCPDCHGTGKRREP